MQKQGDSKSVVHNKPMQAYANVVMKILLILYTSPYHI